MDCVLDTTELLELVLLELDYQTLLGSCLRVCRRWNELIKTSPQIQRILFYKEEKLPPNTCTTDTTKTTTTTTSQYPHQHARQNPLIDGKLSTFLHKTAATKDSLCIPKHMLEGGGVMARDEASWHDMFVQQPPAHKIGIWKMEYGHYLTHGYGMEVDYLPTDDEDGFRMGSLVEYARETARQGYRCAIFSGAEGRKQLDRHRKSLLVTKAPWADQRQICSMIDKSDIVLHLVKCPASSPLSFDVRDRTVKGNES
ncbi:hypothetical protein BD289DRAFT_447443 [Coniella lustricola]|uniref:F-box domain-containing protein n=1 Tax=Coniella lustricola TaxID=2025994 RepID=A0A2T2ZT38_9PEZI|nr:hypothetical protein BD289DRAFT_447443 [Coniella lustricola]